MVDLGDKRDPIVALLLQPIVHFFKFYIFEPALKTRESKSSTRSKSPGMGAGLVKSSISCRLCHYTNWDLSRILDKRLNSKN